MRHLLLLLLTTFLCTCGRAPEPQSPEADGTETDNTERPDYAMVIHGGAGTILPKNMTPEKESAIRAAMNTALDAGEKILADGGSAADRRRSHHLGHGRFRILQRRQGRRLH